MSLICVCVKLAIESDDIGNEIWNWTVLEYSVRWFSLYRYIFYGEIWTKFQESEAVA